MKKTTLLFTALFSSFVFADTITTNRATDDSGDPIEQLNTIRMKRAKLDNPILEKISQLPRSLDPKEINGFVNLYKEFQVPILFLEGRASGLSGHCAEEINKYKEVLALKPDEIQIKVELIAALFEQHRDNEAKELIKNISEEKIKGLIGQQINEYLMQLPKRNKNTDLNINRWASKFYRNFYCVEK